MLVHGVDIVEVDRIAGMLRDHGGKFLERCFTLHERQYAESQPKRMAEHLAARFAAKEAAMKALGTGLAGGITWQDVEVRRGPTGAPALVLSGVAAQVATEMGITRWAVSLSHTEQMAMASVIGWP